MSILSDSRLLRDVLGEWLQRQEDIQWVAVAGSTLQLLQRLGGRAADILLVHAKTDGVLARHLVFDVRTMFPATHLIVLQSQHSAKDIASWRQAGAIDYLGHDSSPAQLLQSIREAARGRSKASMAGHPYLVDSVSAHREGQVDDIFSETAGAQLRRQAARTGHIA